MISRQKMATLGAVLLRQAFDGDHWGTAWTAYEGAAQLGKPARVEPTEGQPTRKSSRCTLACAQNRRSGQI